MFKLNPRTRFAILIAFFITYSINAYCGPAYPYPITFTQPDGTKITITLKGDERVSWAETTDGYSILFNKEGAYEYAKLDSENNMVPSGIPVTNDKNALINTPKGLKYSSSQVQMMNAARSVYLSEMTSASSASGDRKLICILIGFKDKAFAKTKAEFDNLFNQINYTADAVSGISGSVKDFYLQNSYNKLNLNVTVAGVYTASHNMDYYGANSKLDKDTNLHALITEAITLADPDVNYADFDNDGDGSVDGVYVIYAGFAEAAGAAANTVWPCAGGISTLTFDGKDISNFSCSSELRGTSGTGITRIGAICHEFGHMLGAPDFYDTDYATGGKYNGTGMWDLMSDGSWNNGGATPANHNAYTKTMIYKWATLTTLSGGTQITLNNAAENSTSFYKYNTGTAKEYYILENRQQVNFDASIPGHGLIIYHADEKWISDSSTSNTINAGIHQGLYPMSASSTAANGITTSSAIINSASCPFPGTGNKTSFTDATTPCSKSWANANTNKPITAISENATNKTITLNFMGGLSCTLPTTQAISFTSSALANSSMTIGWTRGSGNSVIVIARQGSEIDEFPINGTAYSADAIFGKGSQIGVGNFVVYNGSGTSVNISGLAKGTTFYYAVYEYTASSYCYLTPGLIGNASTTGTPLCSSSGGGADWPFGITLVKFNTLNNTSGKIAGYNDYTALNTTVKKNSAYTLTVNLTTYPGNEFHAFAWIDWNMDGAFGTGESYDLGSANGVMNGKTSISPSITIPNTAQLGITRMRVSCKYWDNPTACDPNTVNQYGEVEDYSIIITDCNPLLTATISGTTSITQNSTSPNITFTGANGTAPYTFTYNINGGSDLTIKTTIGNSVTIAAPTSNVGSFKYNLINIMENASTCPQNQIGSATITVIPSAPTVSSPIVYCKNVTPSQLTANGSNLVWYTVSTNGTGSSNAPTPITSSVGTVNYYVSQTINGIESSRALIAVTTNAIPSAPGITSGYSYCQNASATQLSATGSNLSWYTDAISGTGSSTAPTPSTSSQGSFNYYVSQTTNGCESSRANINVTINLASTGDTVAIACGSYAWNGITYNQDATPTKILKNKAGCDSTVTLHLTINQPTASDTIAIACSSFKWNEVTYTDNANPTKILKNKIGCDSTVTLHLTINKPTIIDTIATACSSFKWNEVTYTDNATPTKTFKNKAGCDSTIRLHLTIDKPISIDTIATACGSFKWDEVIYTDNATPTKILKTKTGCDSTIRLHLTIEKPTTIDTIATACGSFKWDDVTYTDNATQTKNLKTKTGCDSTIRLHLTINKPTTGDTTATGFDSFTWHGNTYYTNGDYTKIFKNNKGCDSLLTLHLTLNPTTGIKTSEVNNVISIYPNPITAQLNIEITGKLTNTKFEIFNTMSQIVYSGILLEKTTISTDSFAPGVYVLKIANGDSYEFRKIVKE